MRHLIFLKISEIETPFGKRILIKKRKIKEQMKIILAQYFEIFQILSSVKISNKNIIWNNKKILVIPYYVFLINFAWRWNLKNFEILRQDDFHLFLDFSFLNFSYNDFAAPTSEPWSPFTSTGCRGRWISSRRTPGPPTSMCGSSRMAPTRKWPSSSQTPTMPLIASEFSFNVVK